MSVPAPKPAFSAAAVKRGADWLRGMGADSDVVVSSRVRLARNIAGAPFLSKATRQQRAEILDLCRDRLLFSGISKQMLWVDVHNAPPLDRTLMLERHLISKEHAKGVVPGAAKEEKKTPSADAPEPAPQGAAGAALPAGEVRGVAISLPDEAVSVMVNEEDHLRLQVLLSGLELTAAYARIDQVDDLIPGASPRTGRVLEYAFSPTFGYLTCCPTNVGTGIRVSVMLHLPGLKLTGELDKMRRATRDMNLAVRGYYGEGSEAAGEFFQISNQTTLGKPESQILHEFEQEIIPQVINYERQARRVLLEKRRRLLEDRVFRALGLLRHARLLSPEEATTMLSDVRLGVVTGLVKGVTEQDVNQLILLTQPAHLQRVLGKEMDQNTRREARADMVREKLAG
ncbi:MAG TPA: protein arginine kinase [Phycisphaerales bacterium]|jgi:protein arginine kinase|nr:protein arginine kinase [Phycisphaerales bacterium]